MQAVADHGQRHIDVEMAKMGRQIFSDTRFSRTGKTACASCHKPEYSFSDNHPLSTRDDGSLTRLGTPALFNLDRKLGFLSRQTTFSLEEAAQRCMDTQMGSAVADVYAILRKDATLSHLAAENTGRVSAGAVYQALTEYLYSLQARPSRYELFLAGNLATLTRQEQKGMALFDQKGCRFCHTGLDMGGIAYGRAVNQDYLRPVLVPRLYNLEHTAPYFSDGSAATVKEAVQAMHKMHNKSVIDTKELELITLFLLSHRSSIHDFEGAVRYGNIR